MQPSCAMELRASGFWVERTRSLPGWETHSRQPQDRMQAELWIEIRHILLPGWACGEPGRRTPASCWGAAGAQTGCLLLCGAPVPWARWLCMWAQPAGPDGCRPGKGLLLGRRPACWRSSCLALATRRDGLLPCSWQHTDCGSQRWQGACMHSLTWPSPDGGVPRAGSGSSSSARAAGASLAASLLRTAVPRMLSFTAAASEGI